MKLSVPKGESPVSAGVVPGSQASGKVANCEVRTEARLPDEAGKPDCGVCTDEQKPHTEAMRRDEVPHAAEVQSLFFF